MNLILHVWRQKDSKSKGKLVTYEAKDINSNSSFLEMIDQVNEGLLQKGEEPIAFDHDCREGICGTCSCMINGEAHGPQKGTTTCQLHMRSFKDGDHIYIEPWRSVAFPVIKDLIVDRSAFDRIIQAGGFVSVNTGGVVDANSVPIGQNIAERAFDAAACIGCGACVASCPNGSPMLFVGAKISHLAFLPQGKIEAERRALNMVAAMDKEHFGNCSNTYECEAACPKEIKKDSIAKMNREYISAALYAHGQK